MFAFAVLGITRLGSSGLMGAVISLLRKANDDCVAMMSRAA
jgi:hypothetical protein